MLYAYSVTPLKEDHFEERCADIRDLIRRRVIQMPIFSMTLVPEGNPVWDKAGKMAVLYARYRDALAEDGIACGILVQASLGHGYPITPNPFQPYVGMRDGKEKSCCCPEDPLFTEHFCAVLRTLAKEHPKVIMLDDDFRMLLKDGQGCACPLHMREFNRRAGTNMTRAELAEHIAAHDDNDALTDIFRDIQHDSLVKTAKAFREAVDSVDPAIQGINCTSGHLCEAVADTSAVWAGDGNPRIVRLPNGIYAPLTPRGFSDLMRNSAICRAKLKKRGVDILLAETDTIPFNRYAKSARYLHAQYTAAILEGMQGAKHWLSRSAAFEPASGKAYRDILAKHCGMYEKLADLANEIRWVGINAAFIEQDAFRFHKPFGWRLHKCDWIAKHLERMGLPFYFAEENDGFAIIEEGMVPDMTDEQINALFAGSVLVDGQSAADLEARGFGALLGVTVKDWTKGKVSGETFDGTANQTCTAQKNPKETEVRDARVQVLSHNYRLESGEAHLLAPAVTKLKRENGALSVVFCGSPDVAFDYGEGFAFLNETRKQQFVSLMKEANVLPIYCAGDDEICLRAGYLRDGTMLAAIYNLGLDPADPIRLYLREKSTAIEMLGADGSLSAVAWEAEGNDIYRLDARAETMYPVILFLRK